MHAEHDVFNCISAKEIRHQTGKKARGIDLNTDPMDLDMGSNSMYPITLRAGHTTVLRAPPCCELARNLYGATPVAAIGQYGPKAGDDTHNGVLPLDPLPELPGLPGLPPPVARALEGALVGAPYSLPSTEYAPADAEAPPPAPTYSLPS
ncbi:hypothetical protein [Streptomyces phaeoluteigriseus]|uniref:hypothetical protein n=1 Tax=Streptomyces phaeoluteigriseus TaxID=114686 RepID=UPI00117EE31E|nr:hypothetical protein [Streptomyces phaeoluteigriseus]